ncbi:MAG: 3-methyl-2-oxobutanoate hydroxymethyltransferase [Acidimicrobiia bacterium]
MQRLPTLLHSCARAATASEARFRVDYPNSKTRATRIIGLDPAAVSILDRISAEPWKGAHFLTYRGLGNFSADGPDAVLESLAGGTSRLSDELDGADVAIMVATSDEGAEAASIIGDACFLRRIMTAGLVVGDGTRVDQAVTALRPFASVLVVSADEGYVLEVLGALRA